MYSRSLQTALAISAILQLVAGQCMSFGWDFVDGGQNYFINNLDTAPFSFGTIFTGCMPDDTQGLITPIVVDPDENEYFCSDIADSPDGAVQMSSCNLPGSAGPPLYKNNMKSGTYYIVVEGLTFAWMRTFTIIAGPQTTITATPTAIFSVTTTPSTTISTTFTSEFDTTLPALTYNLTLPSTTITKTATITPPKVTVTTTSITTKTKASVTIFSKVWTTIFKTLTCPTQTPKKDPTCTLTLSRTSLQASSTNATATAASRRGRDRKVHPPRVPDRRAPLGGQRGQAWRRYLLAKRTADLPTTVVVETTYIATIYTTFTGATSTEVDTFYTTVTSTITPPPVTSTIYSGRAKTTTTVTANTPTRTMVVHSVTTVWTVRTIIATVTITSKITPNSLVCKAGATPTTT